MKRKSSREPLPGEYQHSEVERRLVEGAGHGAFAKTEISAGTLVTRATGFHALGMRKIGVFADMLRQLSSSEESVKMRAQTLLSRCFDLCPDKIEEELLKPWEEETEDFKTLCKEYSSVADVIRFNKLTYRCVGGSQCCYFSVWMT